MAEYIDKKALLDEICRDNCERPYDGTCHNCRMTETIADFPAADVAPVVHGKWEFSVFVDGDANDPRCKCSECGSIETPLARHKYCPNCGARMDGETK